MSVCGEIENINYEISQLESLILDAHHLPGHSHKNQLIAQVNELERRLRRLERVSVT
jgi:hypothetical protein